MKDAERAGELITDLLKDLGAGSYGVDTRAAEQQRDGSESPQLRRQRREHRRERVRSYIVILILLGVIAYFFLEKL
jgi:type VI protein secretion system component VasF